jgi:hypothetical protein
MHMLIARNLGLPSSLFQLLKWSWIGISWLHFGLGCLFAGVLAHFFVDLKSSSCLFYTLTPLRFLLTA